MRGRMSRAGLGAVAGLCLLPAGASAHTISLGPKVGALGSSVVVQGRAWQPFGRVSWQYFSSTLDSRPAQSGSFKLNGSGAFVFRWRDTVVALTHRLCFRQLDTRRGRAFLACSNFWLSPPTASVSPPDGRAGGTFLALASGFPPGARLSGTVTFPDGRTQAIVPRTVATRDGFVQERIGPVFVRRGGAAIVLTSSRTDPAGRYIIVLRTTGWLATATVELS